VIRSDQELSILCGGCWTVKLKKLGDNRETFHRAHGANCRARMRYNGQYPSGHQRIENIQTAESYGVLLVDRKVQHGNDNEAEEWNAEYAQR